MTHRFFNCLALLLSTFGIVVHASAGEADLVTNGGFEARAVEWKPGTVAEGWSMDKADTLAPGEFAVDRAIKHSGNAAARFTDATHGLMQRIPVTPGMVYNIRFWAKSNITAGGFGIHVSWLDNQGKWVVDKNGQQVSNGSNVYGINDWREVRISNVRAPANAAFAHLASISIIEIDHIVTEGTYWIDDVSMVLAPADRATSAYRPSAQIGQAVASPTVDGALVESTWADATEIGSFSVPEHKVVAQQQTSVAMTYDRDALYLGITASDSNAQAMVARTDKHDGQFVDEDVIEIHLNTGSRPATQLRLAFNVNATRADAKLRWRENASNPDVDASWNPDWHVAIQKGKTAWTAEMKIPFDSIGGAAPKVGSSWGFNVIRHRPADDERVSSWSALESSAIDAHESLGTLVFGSGAAQVRDAAFSAHEISVEIANHDQQPLKSVARINRRDGDTYWQLHSREIELAPGERRQIALPAPETDDERGLAWLTVEADGKVLFREGCLPQKEFAAVDWNDPLNVLGQKLYVATDLRTFKPIQTNHNFEGGIAGPQLIERSQRAVDLIVELPHGVRATHVVQFINNWRWWNPVEPAEIRNVSADAESGMSRYRFELPCIMNNWENSTMVFFETDLTAGTRANGKCYLQWDTGRQPSHPLEIEVLTVGRMPPFKRLFNGIYYAEAELLLTWLPELARDYPALGLNRLEIDPSPETGGSQGGANKGPSRRQWFDKLVEQARAGGLYMATSPSQSTPWAQNWMTVDPSARALDIDGKEIVDYGNMSLCVLYRGHKYQEHVDKIAKGPAFNEYGLSWLAIDLELWSDEAWAKGCYCSRCLHAYPNYVKEHHSNATPGDPRVFMKAPQANSEQAAYWKEFRKWSKQEFIRSFRTPLTERIKIHGQTSGPRPGLLVSEWIPPFPHLFDVVDYFEVNCYRKPAEVARRLGEFGVKVSGARKNIVAAQGLGQTHGLDAMLTTQDMLHSIYEAAAAGVQGMVWYDVTSLDALKLKTLVDGCRAVQPFEDIIVDGACTVSMDAKPEPAGARRVMLGNEALLVVRNYGTPAEALAEVTWPEPLGDEAVIFDVQTRERVGSISATHRSFKLKLAGEQARLLYVGPADAWDKRITGNSN